MSSLSVYSCSWESIINDTELSPSEYCKKYSIDDTDCAVAMCQHIARRAYLLGQQKEMELVEEKMHLSVSRCISDAGVFTFQINGLPFNPKEGVE